jgi:O-antigen/teichoic acid export membrane protein
MKERSVKKNMLFNTAGSIIYYFCIWILSILVVRFSGFEEAGVFSLATSVTASPAIIGLFNIRSYQVSDLQGEYSDRTYLISRIVTNALSFFVCFIIVAGNRYTLYKAMVIMVYMLYKMTEGTADVYYGIEQKNGRLDYTGISLAIRGIAGVAFFCFTYLISDSLFFGILSMVVVSMIIIEGYDRKKTTVFMKKSDMVAVTKVKSLLITCFPLAVVAFLNNLSIIVPRIYLEKYFGDEVMGIYSSISSPTLVIQLVAATLFAPLVPFLTEKFQQKDINTFKDTLKKFLVLVIILSVISVFASKLLAKSVLIFLFGEGIIPYVYLFLPVIGLSILIGINNCMLSICTLIREIKSQYIVGAAGIISTVVLSQVLIEKYSMEGVVAATIGTVSLQIIIQFIIVIKKLSVKEK